MPAKVRICEALSCVNNNSNSSKSFFSFPEKDPERLEKWLSNIELKSSTRKRKYLCSDHFEMSKFTNTFKRRLLPEAVPTLKDLSPPLEFNESDSETQLKRPFSGPFSSACDQDRISILDNGADGNIVILEKKMKSDTPPPNDDDGFPDVVPDGFDDTEISEDLEIGEDTKETIDNSHATDLTKTTFCAHSNGDPSNENNEARCEICEKIFKHRYSLHAHTRNFHKIFNNNLKCPAPQCSDYFPNYKLLREHIEYTHGVTIEMECLKFPTFKDFELWLDDMQKQSNEFYIRKQFEMSKTTIFYDCHRSGYYNSAVQFTRKRYLKNLGTKKINGFCSSSIAATVKSQEIEVKFWKTHFGHETEIEHTFLLNSERRDLTSKIAKGVPLQRILQNVKSDTKKFGRIHLSIKKDLHNIKRDFHISNAEEYHENDAVLDTNSCNSTITDERTENNNEIGNIFQTGQIEPSPNYNSDISLERKIMFITKEICHKKRKLTAFKSAQAHKLADKLIKLIRQKEEKFPLIICIQNPQIKKNRIAKKVKKTKKIINLVN